MKCMLPSLYHEIKIMYNKYISVSAYKMSHNEAEIADIYALINDRSNPALLYKTVAKSCRQKRDCRIKEVHFDVIPRCDSPFSLFFW